MSTMLPFTLVDLAVSAVAVGALLALSLAVFLIARHQQPARRALVLPPVGSEAAASQAPHSSAATSHA